MNKKKFSLIVLIFGILLTVAGATLLILNFVIKPDTRDAEYLVSVGEWSEMDADGVIWNFTEIGKGTLTTNNHANDYDFIWAIDGDKIKIETSWLKTLNNEYTYKIDQGAKTLTLKVDDESIVFLPHVELDTAGSVDTEVTEDN
jgi:hypothetical protein